MKFMRPKILSMVSTIIVDVVIWPKFGNASLVTITMTRNTNFYEDCSWINFNNLGLVLGMALKFYTSVEKELELKVGKSLVLLVRLYTLQKKNW